MDTMKEYLNNIYLFIKIYYIYIKWTIYQSRKYTFNVNKFKGL